MEGLLQKGSVMASAVRSDRPVLKGPWEIRHRSQVLEVKNPWQRTGYLVTGVLLALIFQRIFKKK